MQFRVAWPLGLVPFLCLWLTLQASGTEQEATVPLREMNGFRVAPDFIVEPFADDKLAHDIYSMTIDPQGRVVVAGPGYVRILVDDNQDGRADRAIDFSKEPKNGAQSLVYHGRDLLAVGDQGIVLLEDRDGDDRVDGPAKVYLQMKTGGEHDTHSLQKGPDGWWYLLAGNMAQADSRYVTIPSSPVKKPVHGVWMRIRPDLKAAEVLTDGLRNAYDFAFDARGLAHTFDSDDERDISLPWYRPTRVLELTPSVHMGWESNSWKRPDSWFDSPKVLAQAGRGSPTGVISYRHHAFGEAWKDTLFVLDWTYGRVLAIRPHAMAKAQTKDPELILTAAPGHGFAPTDLEVAPDGSIYVCVGGRGTQGGVYRLSPRTPQPNPQSPKNEPKADRAMRLVLDAPQPLSSWSRAQWVPLARQAGREALVAAALDSMRTDAQRIRAIEAITELYGGLKPIELDSIAKASTAPVQARAIWSTFRGGELPDAKLLTSLLSNPTATQPTTVSVEPLVAQAIFEGVLTTDPAKISSEWWNQLAPAITAGLSHSDRLCRLLASRLVARIPEEGLLIVAGEAGKKGPRAALAYAHGWIDRTDSLERRMDSSAAQVAVKVLQKSNDAELQQEAIRLMEKILGGVGGPTDVPPAFLGYVPGLNLLPVERQIDQLRIDLAQVYLERAIVDRVELERLLAMIELAHEPVLTKLLDQLTPASHPVDDIHVLAVSAWMRVARTAAHREAIATAFLRLDQKMTERKLPRDTFWNDRVRDIYNAQCATDELLPVIMAQHPELGRSQHVLYLAKFPGELFSIALAGFLKQIEADPSYQWSSDVLFLLASSNEPAHREMVRKQAQEFRLKNAAIIALSDKPDAIDRNLFLDGLAAPQKEVIAAAITALEALPPASDAASQVAILSAARKLQSDKGEYRLREKLIQLLERNLGHRETLFIEGETGFVPQPEALNAWEAYLIRRFPQEMANRINSASEDHREVVAAWREAKGATGDAERGAILFRSRTCHQCHSGAGQSTSNALGPDLAGAAKRFSRDDLLLAIIDPSRDVSARYQATLIEHKDGRSLSGMIVYESVDGLLLRNATGQVVRVEANEIEERRLMNTSLMPAGLLKGASIQELADIEAYLQKTE